MSYTIYSLGPDSRFVEKYETEKFENAMEHLVYCTSIDDSAVLFDPDQKKVLCHHVSKGKIVYNRD